MLVPSRYWPGNDKLQWEVSGADSMPALLREEREEGERDRGQMGGRVRTGVQIGKPLRVGRFQPWGKAKGLETWISVSLE